MARGDPRPEIGSIVRRNSPGNDHPSIGVFHENLYKVEGYPEGNRRHFYLEGVNSGGIFGREQWSMDHFDLVEEPKPEPIIPWWESPYAQER